MRTSIVFCVCLSLFVSLGASASLAQSDVSAPIPVGATPDQAALNLLDARWEKNRTNRNSAQVELEKYPSDPKVLFAYSLNRMHHNRNSDAIKAIRKLTGSNPDFLEARVIRIWLEALRNNHEIALSEMGLLGDKIANAKKPIAAQEKSAILMRLGRLVGYYQGPALTNTQPDLLANAMTSIAAGLNQDELRMFNTSRELVLNKFERLTQANAQKVTDEKNKLVAAHENRKQSLSDENDQIEKRANDIEPRVDALKTEGFEKLEQVRAEAVPLQQELSALKTQINTATLALDRLYLDLASVRAFNARRDINGNFIYDRRFPTYGEQVLTYEIQNRQLEIGLLRDRFRSVDNQLAGLEQRGFLIQRDYEGAIAGANSELNSLENNKRRNNKELQKLAKGPRVAKGKLESIRSRAFALKTYDPISLEAYRQRYLAKLK